MTDPDPPVSKAGVRVAYAHTVPGAPAEAWHRLEDHLRDTAARSAKFAEPWGGRDIAYLAGLWHDLGKFAPDWQAFLLEAGSEAPVLGEDTLESAGEPRRRRRGPDHSSAGAIHTLKRFGEKGSTLFFSSLALRFAIAAHHAGLADRQNLKARLDNPEKSARYDKAVLRAGPEILEPGIAPSLPPFLQTGASSETEKTRLWRQFEAFVRMIFSALVDADFLDTEAFVDSSGGTHTRPVQRQAWQPLAEYLPVLDASFGAFDAVEATPLNRARRRVREWCFEAAERPSGAFTLTVPTGGGKTLSSLAFALHHAQAHGQERVIVALPFLSILDQTADVYRKVFENVLGPALVEHHSSVTPDRDTMANRLASENWDAPLIVTTQVQLFESLFSNRPRHCRKLHNLANSVIILDEAQTLPVELLAPILDQLQELRENYRTTLVLTTATQPALHSRDLGSVRFEGLNPEPFEIVPREEKDSLFAIFRRIETEWPVGSEPVEWAALAQQIVESRQVLAIVHRRQDARDLWEACESLAAGEQLHLSALMCPAHRREVLARIRALLSSGSRCRLISTQLVEAGVDVDFPIVYRAMAGLESLAQSAGRCNREGRLPEAGRFVVFNAVTEPPNVLKLHRDIARVMLRAEPGLDLAHPSSFRRYFDQLYATRRLDVRGIQPLRSGLRFAEVAARFRMMDDAGETIFVPYGEAGRRAVNDVRDGGISASALRRLQAFGVSVYPDGLLKLRSQGALELVQESIWVLVSDLHYDANLGLTFEANSSSLIV
jgi:CRISPR-associated endonuclease/helicase Cas3